MSCGFGHFQLKVVVKKVNNLAEYKKAKESVPKLKKHLTALEQCVTILTPHKNTVIIYKLLDDIVSLKIVLNSHLIKQTSILQKKGSK